MDNHELRFLTIEDQNPTPRLVREAEARLKLHLQMARLRTAIRAVQSAREWGDAPWRENLIAEVDQVLAHLGYCALHGYRVGVPYLLQDVVGHTHGNSQPYFDKHNLPSMDTLQFMAEDDVNILATTNDFAYWWKQPNAQVAAHCTNVTISSEQFSCFLEIVLRDMLPTGSMKSPPGLILNWHDIPGLSARPNMVSPQRPRSDSCGDHPQDRPDLSAPKFAGLSKHRPGFPADAPPGLPRDRPEMNDASCADSAGLSPSSTQCGRCVALQTVLTMAFEDVEKLMQRVDSGIRAEGEAMHRSAAKIGAYHILGTIYREQDKLPFENGRLLRGYRSKYPICFAPIPYQGDVNRPYEGDFSATAQYSHIHSTPPGKMWISPATPEMSSDSEGDIPANSSTHSPNSSTRHSAGTSLPESDSDSDEPVDVEVDDVSEGQQVEEI
ncbi:hypothetical protein HYPSUDRAFT_1067936 [Hypholoma sublateritium FD-334 SS-4]|uniref:Uncharacterized protein n=1 Tax=Hypholoma sublateritium (strain FD-334 SS-4) TaxID=945553 RepID=A0A0D2KM57_HYPSF|nr:hypothetical protein HYPSUDRAFT_1067936 [Hypholoma sublateritium FD-334 SS-4]